MDKKRRNFIASLVGGAVVPFLFPLLDRVGSQSIHRQYLRPPGAGSEKSFLDACIACGQCANVCPNQCINFYGLEKGIENFATPKIDPRAKGCILCMACTQVCPTNALETLEDTEKGKLSVNMGKAFVQEDICYSFAKRTCGVCYRACPLPGKAITLGIFEQPHVHRDYCVGCGLCEQACIHLPQAIRVTPAHALDIDYA